MPLKIAIQMDPVERLKFETDSTILLAEEAQRRGHSVFYYTPDTMALRGATLTALVKSLDIDRAASPPWRSGAPERANLQEFDLILMRQDPPFDMAYITATHLLEHVMKDVLVLNDPVSVRNAPEKLLVTHFPDLMPPTVITSDADEIRAFYQEHGDIVLKPLYGNAGLHVLHIGPESDNLNGAIKIFQDMYREPIIAQKY
ncbi:MAG: glutathione synthase, partial [Alphaproteobacteria bacterium]|nr:glutathione synthase [Alphaproteobacteria bacterium]